MANKTIKTVNYSLMNITKSPVDSKKSLAPGAYFNTLTELLTYLNDVSSDAYYEGFTFEDPNNSITWQLYNDGSTWKARVYDGSFYVKAININSATPLVDTEIQGSATCDGVLCEEGDVVLCPAWLGPLNGVYIVHEDEPWERLSIFDEATDTLTGIIFVASQGTNYKNSQWIYSTKGTIIPDGTLTVGYSDWVHYPSTFGTYTWLNFEMVGGQHPLLNVSVASPSINMYNFNVFCDTSSNDIEIDRSYSNFIPFKEYKMVKTNKDNEVLFSINSVYYGLLLDKRDYFNCTLLKNPYDPASDTVDDSFAFESNREHKLIEATISADGKLMDVPVGYRLFNIKGSASGGTGTAYLKIGSSSAASDLIANVEYENDGTIVNSFINETAITEIWISEVVPGSFGFEGNTITYEVLIVKE